MRSVVVQVATSADGYIARPDGDVKWLDRPSPPGDYGMREFYDTVDTVLMGRKTWEIGIKLGQSHYPGKKNYIFSHTAREAEHVEIVTEEPAAFVRGLRSQPGKDIWLVGGGELIATLIDGGEVDRFLIHLIPVLIGEGIPLIAPRHREIELAMQGTKTYPDGVVLLDYAVRKNG
jgi:dihydrofolate reductase